MKEKFLIDEFEKLKKTLEKRCQSIKKLEHILRESHTKVEVISDEVKLVKKDDQPFDAERVRQCLKFVASKVKQLQDWLLQHPYDVRKDE